MKRILTLLFTLLTVSLIAQPIIHNAEKYEIGQEYIYQLTELDPDKMQSMGENLVWDLSQSNELAGKITMMILDPASSKYASSYPGANVLEQNSDGTFVFSNQNEEESTLLGFVDENHDFQISYPVNQLFMKRPIEFNQEENRSYTTSFKVGNYSFSGEGTTRITAPAYGKLILPHAEYENVLLVIIEQEQWDTLVQYKSVSYSKTETFIWFEVDNPAPLLRISKYDNQQGSSLSASWLVKDQVNSTKAVQDRTQINIYPNPATDVINIDADHDLRNSLFSILDSSGKPVIQQHFAFDENTIDISQLSGGMYFVKMDGVNPEAFIKMATQ